MRRHGSVYIDELIVSLVCVCVCVLNRLRWGGGCKTWVMDECTRFTIRHICLCVVNKHEAEVIDTRF